MTFAKTVGDLRIELVEGDITRQPDVAAIVNAANAQLMPGGGTAGAIHRAAGAELADECRPLAPIRPGECVITSGRRLPNPWVIHCLGPVYGVDEPADELLASCYRRALELAEDRDLESIAFPAISAGAFGYPLEDAAELALRTVVETAPRLARVRLVRFVLLGSRALETHRRVLERLLDTRV
jgi:O-acetyl-ADP-ribose deacetylase (regulator of RNase III)